MPLLITVKLSTRSIEFDLWQKLIHNCVDGKVMIIINTIYENAKSCVNCANGLSDFCCIVRC